MFEGYQSCRLCPRACGVNREETTGFCGMGTSVRLARAALHRWEEPCISGKGGSGAVFFSGCTLRCCFCQNASISADCFGADISDRRLADIFLCLQEQGAENINLVTPTHFLPGVVHALSLVRGQLSVPVVMNCGGYEREETIRCLDGLIDVYLPDFKYVSSELSDRYSHAPDYFRCAVPAIAEMIRQCGREEIDVPPEGETLKRGVILRHLVLPGSRKDSVAVLRAIHDSFPEHHYLISLLSQYTPCAGAASFPELNRRVTSYEYDSVLREAQRLNLRGYRQERSSAREEYTPPFNLEGVI